MAALEKVTKLQRSLALRLYRAILTAHRNLPPEMELIGNLYVREEFQRHKNAKPEHLKPFFEQWINYLDTMRSFDPADKKFDLPDDVVVALSDDQRDKLWKMRIETEKLFGSQADQMEALQTQPATESTYSPHVLPNGELDVVSTIVNAPKEPHVTQNISLTSVRPKKD